jgi:uncharacterized protein (DUF305 family)
MNINYKYTTIGLGILFIICLICCVRMMGYHDMNKQHMQNGEKMGNTHMMPDGTMMRNDGGTMMNHDDMGSMMMDMTARMQGKTGDELDKIFLQDMIVHHQGAVDMAKLLAVGTKRPELQKMASDIISVQNKEIDMMKGWEKEWFGK